MNRSLLWFICSELGDELDDLMVEKKVLQRRLDDAENQICEQKNRISEQERLISRFDRIQSMYNGKRTHNIKTSMLRYTFEFLMTKW